MMLGRILSHIMQFKFSGAVAIPIVYNELHAFVKSNQVILSGFPIVLFCGIRSHKAYCYTSSSTVYLYSGCATLLRTKYLLPKGVT